MCFCGCPSKQTWSIEQVEILLEHWNPMLWTDSSLYYGATLRVRPSLVRHWFGEMNSSHVCCATFIDICILFIYFRPSVAQVGVRSIDFAIVDLMPCSMSCALPIALEKRLESCQKPPWAVNNRLPEWFLKISSNKMVSYKQLEGTTFVSFEEYSMQLLTTYLEVRYQMCAMSNWAMLVAAFWVSLPSGAVCSRLNEGSRVPAPGHKFCPHTVNIPPWSQNTFGYSILELFGGLFVD